MKSSNGSIPRRSNLSINIPTNLGGGNAFELNQKIGEKNHGRHREQDPVLFSEKLWIAEKLLRKICYLI